MANGDEIDNKGEKKLVGNMVTFLGGDSGGRGITAQICDVHRPLMSVKRMCKSGHRVVFDDEGSYIESKQTGEKLRIIEEDGEYLLDVWVKAKETNSATFGGQER